MEVSVMRTLRRGGGSRVCDPVWGTKAASEPPGIFARSTEPVWNSRVSRVKRSFRKLDPRSHWSIDERLNLYFRNNIQRLCTSLSVVGRCPWTIRWPPPCVDEYKSALGKRSGQAYSTAVSVTTSSETRRRVPRQRASTT